MQWLNTFLLKKAARRLRAACAHLIVICAQPARTLEELRAACAQPIRIFKNMRAYCAQAARSLRARFHQKITYAQTAWGCAKDERFLSIFGADLLNYEVD